MEKEEEWKKISNNTKYEISDRGRVRSSHTSLIKILTPNIETLGYTNVVLCDDNSRHTVRIHRLVAELFIPMVEGLTEIDHINGNRSDNRIENLRWSNRSLNMTNTLHRKNNENFGITYRKERNHYRITLSVNGKPTYMGSKSTIEEARQFRNQLVSKTEIESTNI